MRILLVNDDGYKSDGIILLAKKLNDIGHNVVVCAPDRERSGMSHALTFHSTLSYTYLEVDTIPVYVISGTPADCTKFSITQFLKQKPDLIISGINNVVNVGSDLFYSGTTSAALEGSLNGIKSIAVSLDEFNGGFDFAISFIVNNLDKLVAIDSDPLTMININIPSSDRNKIKGVKITKVGKKYYSDKYVSDNGIDYYMQGNPKKCTENSADTDVVSIEDGYISISPVKVEFTHYKLLEQLQKNNLNWNL